MSWLLWHRRGDTRVAGSRLVLRAAEVPLLRDAQALRDALEQRLADEESRITAAAAEARDAAFAGGLAAGRAESERQLLDTVARLDQAAVEERERMRNQVGALALQVVRKMLGPFAGPDLLVALAESATNELLPAPPMACTVHPDRVEALRGRLRCDVRADPSFAPDACRLETEHGSIEVSLDAQLGRLADAWGVR